MHAMQATSRTDSGLASTSSTSMAWARKLGSCKSAADVADLIAADGNGPRPLSEEDAEQVLITCLERGREDLALGIYRDMCLSKRSGIAGTATGSAWDAGGVSWPAATIRTTSVLVLGLCKQLSVVEAMAVINGIKGLGLATRRSEDVGFGKVIACPLAPTVPLAVVQPQEGCKVVADSVSRYEYELFSGSTVGMSSEALSVDGNLLLAALRAVGLLKRPAVGAVHEFVLRAPDGTSRTFRVGTESNAVPAQVGERLTVVSAPLKNQRKGGLFNASPPGTKPGEGLMAVNHNTNQVLQLVRPPVSSTQTGLPAWVLPTAVLLAGGDAASSLLDPSLPLLIAAGASSLAATAITTRTVLVPRLKQLPENRLRGEAVRQRLLGQYSALADKVAGALSEVQEDVRFMARLWQLQNKMEAVAVSAPAGASVSGSAAVTPSASSSSSGASSSSSSSGASSSSSMLGYSARIERLAGARSNIESRLVKRLELLEGYSRVMNMIEIEVEMDMEVPAAEVVGIEAQINKLVELESLQEDWRTQAEARDEVRQALHVRACRAGQGRAPAAWCNFCQAQPWPLGAQDRSVQAGARHVWGGGGRQRAAASGLR